MGGSLYIAGRMHKPVKTLLEDQRILEAQEQNLSSAVRTAILLLLERHGVGRGTSQRGIVSLHRSSSTRSAHSVTQEISGWALQRMPERLIESLTALGIDCSTCTDRY